MKSKLTVRVPFFRAGDQMPQEYHSVILLLPDVSEQERPWSTAYLIQQKLVGPEIRNIWAFHNYVLDSRIVKETDLWAYLPELPRELRTHVEDKK